MISYFTFYVMCIALKEANKELTETVSSGKKASDKEMFSLSWTVDGLSQLVSLGRQLYAEVTGVLELLEDDQIDVIKKNVASRVSKLQESLFPFIREVTRHQRQKATHSCYNDQPKSTLTKALCSTSIVHFLSKFDD